MIHDRKQPFLTTAFALMGVMVLGAANPAFAGGLRYEVDKAAFAGMVEGDLTALKEPEHRVYVAQAAVETAKVAVTDAEKESKDLKKALSAAEADLAAAKAELKAAKKNEDEPRAKAAEASIKKFEKSVKAGKAKVKWSKKNIAALNAKLSVAEVEMYSEQAHLELARVQLLKTSQRDSAANYIESDFKAQSLQSDIDVEKARSKAEKKANKAKEAFGKYEKIKDAKEDE